MKKRNVKAFTIVELVIVIAVIAILAAVLIPTFSGIIKKANISADEAEIASLNKLIAAGGIKTEADLYAVIAENYGADTADNFAPRSAKHGYHYWYDVAANRMILSTYDELPETAPAQSEGNSGVTMLSNITLLATENSSFESNNPRNITKGERQYFFMDKSGSDLADLFNLIDTISKDTDLDTALGNIEGEIATAIQTRIGSIAILNDNGLFTKGDKPSAIYIPANKTDDVIELGTETYPIARDDIDFSGINRIDLPNGYSVPAGCLTGFSDDTEIHVNAEYDDLDDIFEPDSTDCVIVLPDGSRYIMDENGVSPENDGEGEGGEEGGEGEQPPVGCAHNFVDGDCTLCGASKITSATITFDDVYKRTEISTEKQVWKENGITVTNNKAESTSDVADFANPARFYKSSELIISISGITEIEITANTAAYATALKDSISDNNAIVTADGKIVTITFAEPVDSFAVTLSGGQVRVDSITVTCDYICTHADTEPITKDATCTEDGFTLEVCSVCGKEESDRETITATGHEFGETTAAKDAKCNEAGNSAYKQCTVCEKYFAEDAATNSTDAKENTDEFTIPETDEHNFVGGACDVCGELDPNTSIESEWIKTDLADIKPTDVVVIVWTTSDGKSYAVSNDKGTSAAPTAVEVSVISDKLTGDIDDNIKWNISNDNGNLTIYHNGETSTWLYCTSTNNGVRVGTNENKVFTIEASSGYLKHTGTSRYLGVYTTNPDVRCYTSSTATNIANQTLAFYKYTGDASSGDGGEGEDEPCTHVPNEDDGDCTTPITCSLCGEVTTEANGTHNYVNGVCSVCNTSDPDYNAGVTIQTETMQIIGSTGTLASDNSSISWASESQNFDFVNTKGSTAIRTSDTGHYRVYQNSTSVISAKNGCLISKIVITCTSSDYATACANSVTDEGVTATVNGTEVTITVTSGYVTSIEIGATAQWRLSKVEISYSID